MVGLPADFDSRLLASLRADGRLATGATAPEGALTDTLEAGGKRVRATLSYRFGGLAEADPDAVTDLALAVEFLHAATLVHDDVIDRAPSRRGRPSLQQRHGNEVALLVGDLYVARCGVHLSRTGSPVAAELVWQALDVMVRGEVDQRSRRFDLTQGEDGYWDMTRRKTVSLLVAASAAAVRLGTEDPALVRAAVAYAEGIGLAFQVVDDVLDYAGDPEAMGKATGNDIREGTVTLPLVLALGLSPAPIPAILASARVRDDFSAVVQAVRRSGALERCLEIAAEHTERAITALEAFPAGPDRDALADLARALVRRSA